MLLQIPIQSQRMLVPQRANLREAYDLRALSLTLRASLLASYRQDSQPSSNPTDATQGVQNDAQPRGDNKVYLLQASRKI